MGIGVGWVGFSVVKVSVPPLGLYLQGHAAILPMGSCVGLVHVRCAKGGRSGQRGV